MASNNFSALLDELHAADTARRRAPMRKAQDADWVADWIGTRREREAALAHSSFTQNLRAIGRIGRDFDALAKSMPAPKADPREHFAKAYGYFTNLVAEGRFTAIDACRIEARFHHLEEALR